MWTRPLEKDTSGKSYHRQGYHHLLDFFLKQTTCREETTWHMAKLRYLSVEMTALGVIWNNLPAILTFIFPSLLKPVDSRGEDTPTYHTTVDPWIHESTRPVGPRDCRCFDLKGHISSSEEWLRLILVSLFIWAKSDLYLRYQKKIIFFTPHYLQIDIYTHFAKKSKVQRSHNPLRLCSPNMHVHTHH